MEGIFLGFNSLNGRFPAELPPNTSVSDIGNMLVRTSPIRFVDTGNLVSAHTFSVFYLLEGMGHFRSCLYPGFSRPFYE